MKIVHRYNSRERQHYLLEKHYTFKLNPHLLYVGLLDKQKGWHEEPHAHDFLELVFVLDGCGTVTVEGEERDIKRGDILVYNAGAVHFEKSDEEDPLEIRCAAYNRLQITDLPENWLLPPDYGFLFPSGGMYPVFCDCFEKLLREFERKDRFYTEIAQNEARTLLMHLFRLINETGNIAPLLSKSRILEIAVTYIDEHYTEPLLLDNIAQVCHTDKYYLSHLFSRERGMSVGKYILQKRLDEAKRLLKETEMPVKNVAETAGFGDAGYFCRVFKRECGCTPLSYRNLALAGK